MQKYLIALLIILSSCKKDASVNKPLNLKGEILFISRRIANSADWQMFTMKLDGTNQRVVSNNLVRCAPPVISNSGSKIAFTAYEGFYYKLYIIDTDGKNLKLLSSGEEFCGSPAWSPDDIKIAFVKKENNPGSNYHIYQIAINGGIEKRLTDQNDNFSPQYLPDNNSLIFTSSNNNNWSGVYKMGTDGSHIQLLTPVNKSFSDPKISPNGNKIALTSNNRGGSQIFVMNSNGDNLKQLTSTVSSSYFDTGFPRDGNCNPVWSPDNATLAYVSFENGSPDIFIIKSDGTGNKRLTDTPLRDENPSWTNDGNHILFSSNRNMDVSAEIYIMGTRGQLQTPLTNYFADDIYPVFIYK